MATIRIILGIICLTFSGQFVKPSGDFLGGRVELLSCKGVKSTFRELNNSTAHQLNIRAILAIAQSQIGVREKTGSNDGKEVEQYLAYTHHPKGAPWCAAFVSWVFGQLGFDQPKTAWSPALFPLARQKLIPLPADVFGIYFPALQRIAHCGLVMRREGNYIISIEGNTNIDGSREGDGVYCKRRHLKTIKYFADWISKDRRRADNEK